MHRNASFSVGTTGASAGSALTSVNQPNVAKNVAGTDLDAVLASHVRLNLITGDQALSLAEQYSRHLAQNGHAAQEFPLLKAARSAMRAGFSWMERRAA